ncbi:MAG: 4-oxalocrotonate tautomerase family protein [Veillonella sp.]|nr:4-oxalocrotonate tautomerase family protein [Veillonella sp.]
MPMITAEVAKVTDEQKQQLIEGFTNVAHEVLGFPKPVFYVLIKENDPDNWGVGGERLTSILAKREAELNGK